MGEYQTLSHSFLPVFDENSKILILGTFPSVKSRENDFYYGHPQNRFWRILAGLMSCPVPETVEEKKKFLLEKRIAIWDVIAQCDIIGSSDSSIRNVVPADLSVILKRASISRIYGNGGKACELYQKLLSSDRKRNCKTAFEQSGKCRMADGTAFGCLGRDKKGIINSIFHWGIPGKMLFF